MASEERRIPTVDLRAVALRGPCHPSCDQHRNVHYFGCPNVVESTGGTVIVHR